MQDAVGAELCVVEGPCGSVVSGAVLVSCWVEVAPTL